MAKYESYFNNAIKSVFRFEGLQDYSAMDGDEAVEVFKRTSKLLLLPKDTEWWQEMKEKNKRGIITQRIRLIELPLTDYTKMELTWHKEAAEYSGDDIRVIEKKDFDKIISETIPDFWMIDDQYAFPMEYGPKGKFINDFF